MDQKYAVINSNIFTLNSFNQGRSFGRRCCISRIWHRCSGKRYLLLLLLCRWWTNLGFIETLRIQRFKKWFPNVHASHHSKKGRKDDFRPRQISSFGNELAQHISILTVSRRSYQRKNTTDHTFTLHNIISTDEGLSVITTRSYYVGNGEIVRNFMLQPCTTCDDNATWSISIVGNCNDKILLFLFVWQNDVFISLSVCGENSIIAKSNDWGKKYKYKYYPIQEISDRYEKVPLSRYTI